jgi:hypothetical protein
MLAGFDRLENLNLYSAGDDAAFSDEIATELAGRTDARRRRARGPDSACGRLGPPMLIRMARMPTG